MRAALVHRLWALLAALACVLGNPCAQALAAPARLSQGGKPAAKAAHPAPDKAPKKHAPAAATATMVGWIELAGPLAEAPPPLALAGLPDMGKPTLRRVLEKIRQVAADPHYAGLVIALEEPELGLDQVDEITLAIRGVRAAGKKVFVYASSYDLRGYLLACSADRVLLLKKGMLELAGIGVEEIYLAGLLEKIGVKADMLQVGKFKGASEPFTRTGPSPEWTETFDALLDDVYAQALDRIAAGRRLSREQVEKAMADCWTMSDKQYVERKLVDQLVDRDLIDFTEREFGKEFDWDDMLAPAPPPSMDNPFALMQMLFREAQPVTSRPSLAVIHASGSIVSGEGGGGGLFGEASVGSRTMIETLGQAQDDDLIRGVVLRIDSPGGSALASEEMWQAIRELSIHKPVYVSIGSMAASGGYYLACGGERIYVAPGSIVGSIGVVGGKVVLAGLYEKLGLSVHRRSRGPLGDVFNSVEPFTPLQRAALQSSFDRVYEQFLDRVKQGRGQKVKDLASVAQGRIFTGRQAVANGLADRVGGIELALADLASDLKLKPGSYDVVTLPGPLSLQEYLERMLQEFAAGPAGDRPAEASAAGPLGVIEAARLVLGPRAWKAAQPVLAGLMQLRREPVLTLFPAAVLVR